MSGVHTCNCKESVGHVHVIVPKGTCMHNRSIVVVPGSVRKIIIIYCIYNKRDGSNQLLILICFLTFPPSTASVSKADF